MTGAAQNSNRPWWCLTLDPPGVIHLRDPLGRSLGAMAGGSAQRGDFAGFLAGSGRGEQVSP
ncbi:MAG: hypothetical protein GC191_09350 [Azospirillum sp.]|nr:hypothetical protein [Azospirillum sp.]